MDSRRLIDAQFDRAVEIVQSLPKTGPIQTGYDEKLTMYSLYKQATIGNVKTQRPAMWDMLGRAKWDAWAKHKDLDQYEAKWLYVDALLKVLRKYSDKTVARDLVRELESYGSDSSNNVAPSRTLSKSPNSGSSGSTESEEHVSRPAYPRRATSGNIRAAEMNPNLAEDSTSEDEINDEAGELRAVHEPAQSMRPQSSLSSHRYRTPMAGSLAMSPPPVHMHMNVPATQPLPGFKTPSAFADPSPPSVPSSLYPATSSYVGQFSESSYAEVVPASHIYDPRYRGHSQPLVSRQYGSAIPIGQSALERAIESVQGHLAALNERLELLETNARSFQRSNVSVVTGGSSPNWVGAGRGSPTDGRDRPGWDLDDLGMWSLLLNPLSRGVMSLRSLATFFARNENRSPTFIVVRRLCLDISFLICVLAVVRAIWRRSGVRRKEVRAALLVLWRALLGSKKDRILVDRGV